MLSILVASCILFSTQTSSQPILINIDSKPIQVKSVKFVLPLDAYFPGAIGVQWVRTKKERLPVLQASEFWQNLVQHSVPSITKLDAKNMRVRIELANNEELLFDDRGRFVLREVQDGELLDWNGPVRELRASQYVSLLGISNRLGP